MANTTEAYDLSLFESGVSTLPGKKQKKADLRHAKIQSLLNTAVAVGLAVCVLAVVAIMITGQVRLTEQNNAITHAQSELRDEVSETRRLESELAAQTSAQSVEEYAESVGLRQIESGQIEYFTVKKPTVQTAESGGGFWQKLWDALTGWM